MIPDSGSRVFSIEFGWGDVSEVSPNGNFGVVFPNREHQNSFVPRALIWYDKNWCRVAAIKTNKTLFKTPQEVLPVSYNSII